MGLSFNVELNAPLGIKFKTFYNRDYYTISPDELNEMFSAKVDVNDIVECSKLNDLIDILQDEFSSDEGAAITISYSEKKAWGCFDNYIVEFDIVKDREFVIFCK